MNQWQDRALEGMLLASQLGVPTELGVALSLRLLGLLKRKSKVGVIKGVEKRLKKLQGDRKGLQELPEVGVDQLP